MAGSGSTVALPVGKRALYSGARPEADSVATTSDNPLADRGTFSVQCERCHQTSSIGVLDLVISSSPSRPGCRGASTTGA